MARVGLHLHGKEKKYTSCTDGIAVNTRTIAGATDQIVSTIRSTRMVCLWLTKLSVYFIVFLLLAFTCFGLKRPSSGQYLQKKT